MRDYIELAMARDFLFVFLVGFALGGLTVGALWYFFGGAA